MDWANHRREAHGLGRTQEFLKQITYGGNDGIVTTFAIVAGFAGAQADGAAQIGALAVLIFGLANLFADGVSMGLGEFLSTRSAQDMFHSRRAKELAALRANPEEERAELTAILRDRGMDGPDVDAAADIIARHPDFVADLMMTYEFGMMEPEADNPAREGLVTFVAFLIFGAVPLSPYFFRPPDDTTLNLSVGMTFLALVLLGLLRWNATRENLGRCLGETVAVGTLCAAVAFGVGRIVGG
ncbi:VIT1/CCC1 transporter family protein [Rhodalgimonas zhirmunskyi]|uniref:VIT1/CCC1 transporter family protein n=1 Tax=Rhodalgimonas zhirmunskyi TaxID=2964767 RepID=A0AAJ1X3T7_9RHOB|nr:VIT1/CCC1 transporter family protein [Rhodoalgimonas zhirmunskyi]MDQ2092841.1 VIT1/CCC1 transporter family protein [Rhodoalgimonas zhirmunskyi]